MGYVQNDLLPVCGVEIVSRKALKVAAYVLE